MAFCPHCGAQVAGAGVFCAECGKSLSSPAPSRSPAPTTSKRTVSGKTIGIALGAAFLLILIMKSCGDSTTQTEKSAANDATSMITKCGIPDEDYSSENENPRPVLPMRTLEYKSQNIRFVFTPPDDTKVGATPPYRWTLSMVLDTVTNEPLDIQIALKRMPCFRTIRER
jgi:hypothetical protein